MDLTEITGRGRRTTENRYIYPPRPQSAIPLTEVGFFQKLGWLAQLKYNDTRCLIKYRPVSGDGSGDGIEVELWNRHAERIRGYTLPAELSEQLLSVHERLGLSKREWSLLDGGLLDQKHPAIADTIVIWDILVLDGLHLLGSTYGDRYSLLSERLTDGEKSWFYTPPHGRHGPVDFGLYVSEGIFVPRNIAGDRWLSVWEDPIGKVNEPYTERSVRGVKVSPVIEGLLIKDMGGELRAGYREDNNSEWSCRTRITTGRHSF